MITEPIDLCRVCGRIRGDLSMLCASCLKQRTLDAMSDDDRYRMQDTVRDGDRERMDSVRDSDGRFYHD